MTGTPGSGGLRFLGSRPNVARLVLAAASLGLTLFCLELVFRSAAYFVGNSGRLEDLERDAAFAAAPGKSPKRRHQIKLSANPRIVYEHWPDSRWVDESGNVHTINGAGFRGPEHPVERGPSTVRIVGLGDSVMYGNGVSDDEIFMARLSRRLDAAYPDAAWEVINTAVGGYNTVMQVETLKQKGLAYAPDIVLILFVGNDLDLPNFIRKPVSFFEPRSFLFDWLLRRATLARARLVAAPKSDEGNWFERDPEKVPAAYRDMVGPDAYRTAMAELKALSASRGFELIVLQQRPRDLVTETCRELGLRLVRFQPAVDRYMEEHDIETFRGSVLSVSRTDPHPSAEGHRIFAEVIFESLESSGAIDRALRRRSIPPSDARPDQAVSR